MNEDKEIIFEIIKNSICESYYVSSFENHLLVRKYDTYHFSTKITLLYDALYEANKEFMIIVEDINSRISKIINCRFNERYTIIELR